MDLPRRPILSATAVVVGLGIYWAAPQGVAAEPAPSVPGPTEVSADPTPVPAPELEPEPATAAPAPAPEPDVDPGLGSAPPLALPAEPAAPAAVAAPAPIVAAAPTEETVVVEEQPSTGTITVVVAVAPGADRTVRVLGLDGEPVAGPLAVTGDPLVLTLPASTFDVLAEHVAHGGGAFVTRIRVTLDPGGQVSATYDPETLDATVVA